MWVKVCGIRKLEDAEAASKAGAQAVGLVFAPSPRQLHPAEAKRMSESIPRQLFRVGVFVDERPEEVERIARYVGLDLIQLHGAESPDYCRYFSRLPWGLVKAWRMDRGQWEQVAEYKGLVGALLLDSSAGSGKTFPWQRAGEVPWDGKLILAGGLSQLNVAQAIAEASPWGVDASSSLESGAGKDPEKIAAFVEAAKNAGRE
jgi:phosphoribosylanthranilate isomerase